MGSKRLESIMANIPSATVTKEITSKTEDVGKNVFVAPITAPPKRSEKIVRVIATVDKSVKQELRNIAQQKETTETVIILQALKDFGFKSIDESMLVDKRTVR